MKRYQRTIVVLMAIALATLAPAHAQEKLGSANQETSYRAGWTFTPMFGFSETYDDNISLFGVNTAEDQNNDLISTIFPGADLHYAGKHTRFGAFYSGSFLNYQTFTALNRWDQRVNADIRR